MKNRNKSPLRLTTLALLCAIAVVIGLFSFPIFPPPASFLKMDFADVPSILATIIFGPTAGLSVLFVVSFVQGILLGDNGWIGLFMHFVASGSMLVTYGIICRRRHSLARMSVSAVIGAAVMTSVMIPLNYIFIPILFGAPIEMINSMVVPFLIPFNLIKSGANSVLAIILYYFLRPLINKYFADYNE